MHEISFDDAVRKICAEDLRIDRDAYYFLREALDATVQSLRSDETPEHQHVNGPELLDGLRDHALEKFGPMTATVLESWGLKTTDDIGHMVFQLIEIGAFGQSPEDTPEDFAARYTFDEAFRQPFRPKRRRARASSETREVEESDPMEQAHPVGESDDGVSDRAGEEFGEEPELL